MRKNFFLFISLLFCSFSILHPALAQEVKPEVKETITIVADTWCPYNCNPASPHPGFMVDVAKQAFARHNIDVVYSIVPWTRAIAETRKGQHNAIVGAAFGDAPDFIFPQIPQGFVQNHFYVKKGTAWRYSGLDSLKNIIIGVISDYSYSDEMDQYISKYKLDPEKISLMSGDKALGINISKMKRDKIGAVLEGKYVMDYYLAQNNMKGTLDDAGTLPPSKDDFLHIAFSPNDKKQARKYAQILSEETAKMRASGELAKILDTYGLKDWEEVAKK